jgi:hypothetical protein
MGYTYEYESTMSIIRHKIKDPISLLDRKHYMHARIWNTAAYTYISAAHEVESFDSTRYTGQSLSGVLSVMRIEFIERRIWSKKFFRLSIVIRLYSSQRATLPVGSTDYKFVICSYSPKQGNSV